MMCMGGMVMAGIVAMEVILTMLVGSDGSCGEKSSSAEPKSFSSFSKSSSWVDSGCWPSCWASWIRRCLLYEKRMVSILSFR